MSAWALLAVSQRQQNTYISGGLIAVFLVVFAVLWLLDRLRRGKKRS